MLGLFLRWLAPFAAILLGAYLFPEWFAVESYEAAALFGLVLALLNAFVRPILGFFALPITCLTLGLFHFVLNAIIFGLAAWLVPGVEVSGALAAFVGALIVSIAGLVSSLLAR
jgi:putative membrane protein